MARKLPTLCETMIYPHGDRRSSDTMFSQTWNPRNWTFCRRLCYRLIRYYVCRSVFMLSKLTNSLLGKDFVALDCIIWLPFELCDNYMRENNVLEKCVPMLRFTLWVESMKMQHNNESYRSRFDYKTRQPLDCAVYQSSLFHFIFTTKNVFCFLTYCSSSDAWQIQTHWYQQLMFGRNVACCSIHGVSITMVF